MLPPPDSPQMGLEARWLSVLQRLWTSLHPFLYHLPCLPNDKICTGNYRIHWRQSILKLSYIYTQMEKYVALLIQAKFYCSNYIIYLFIHHLLIILLVIICLNSWLNKSFLIICLDFHQTIHGNTISVRQSNLNVPIFILYNQSFNNCLKYNNSFLVCKLVLARITLSSSYIFDFLLPCQFFPYKYSKNWIENTCILNES